MFKNKWITLGLIFSALFSVIVFIASQNKAAAQSGDCETTQLPNNLIFIKRFYNQGNNANFDTKVNYAQYHCTAFSWNAR